MILTNTVKLELANCNERQRRFVHGLAALLCEHNGQTWQRILEGRMCIVARQDGTPDVGPHPIQAALAKDG